MKRPLRPEEVSLWTVVTATVRPSAGRRARAPQPSVELTPRSEPAAPAPVKPPPARIPIAPFTIGQAAGTPHRPAPPKPTDTHPIEPGRKRRIVRGRDEIAARLDLHGMDQDRARAALIGFLQRAQADGARAVLVITGKGVSGQGVLRRRAPEWLADPALRTVVAGLSSADARHGGEGALYVALKRLAK